MAASLIHKTGSAMPPIKKLRPGRRRRSKRSAGTAFVLLSNLRTHVLGNIQVARCGHNADSAKPTFFVKIGTPPGFTAAHWNP